jgi:hypothetical protein
MSFANLLIEPSTTAERRFALHRPARMSLGCIEASDCIDSLLRKAFIVFASSFILILLIDDLLFCRPSVQLIRCDLQADGVVVKLNCKFSADHASQMPLPKSRARSKRIIALTNRLSPHITPHALDSKRHVLTSFRSSQLSLPKSRARSKRTIALTNRLSPHITPHAPDSKRPVFTSFRSSQLSLPKSRARSKRTIVLINRLSPHITPHAPDSKRPVFTSFRSSQLSQPKSRARSKRTIALINRLSPHIIPTPALFFSEWMFLTHRNTPLIPFAYPTLAPLAISDQPPVTSHHPAPCSTFSICV